MDDDFKTHREAPRHRTSSMELSGFPKSKRGRSESISGRLRAASDLEEIGWIDKCQKGVIKDLIISGDPTLRSALDKYENGDAHDLEAMIKRGMLERRPSLDLLDGLDLDFLTVGYGGGDLDGDQGTAFDYENDFFFDEDFNSKSDESDLFKMGPGPRAGSLGRADSLGRTDSLGGDSGSFDLGGIFFEGLGGNKLGTGRKHSLTDGTGSNRKYSLSNGSRWEDIGGEVDMFAYQSMAASLQAQTKHKKAPKGSNGVGLGSPLKGVKAAPSSSSGAESKNGHIDGKVSIKIEKNGNDTTSSLLPPHMQQNRQGQRSVSTEGIPLTQQQLQQQHLRQQQLTQMQQKNYGTENHHPNGRMTSIPEDSEGVPHKNIYPQPQDYKSILSSLYNPDGTLCDSASMPRGLKGYVGAYSPEARRERIERFLAKRDKRVWTKKVKYDVRKNFADSRLRVKGRFVKKEDEELMKELLSI
mmetsp:Transcript_19934/g.19249  ORF Transcript_19934/g.19249 Transcript_19934/m.19249 type:complete len:470 (-) Transcript_19934:5-1414(-)|eukprot:CAMPEP_0119039086 /NCGR_PEP_ID=MMETSP1177-20130426/8390_1 /TAXON_ID=2985 /ORGANISM="Ochromonas sp, Strain CCMP1899" /LENGTH=469 /DNA_ID=CAMNT_0007002523 /DNA_START=106 /DNA_END=1515 /DNA_ORIENTATION=+